MIRHFQGEQLFSQRSPLGIVTTLGRAGHILIAAFVALAAQCSAAAQPPPAGTSVLLIMADDLRCSLAHYGDALAQTPNLDRLAARAVRFDRAYCQYPVCNPSRVSMLSGQRPETTLVLDNVTPPRSVRPEAMFLPQWFRDHGYRTLKVGKIFHTGHEFEDPRSWHVDLREEPAAKHPPAEQIVAHQGDGGIVLGCDDSSTWDGQVARHAVELLTQAAAGDQPFFLATGFRRPHTPYIAPQKYFDLYPPAAMPLFEQSADQLAKIPAIALTYTPQRPALPVEQRQPTMAAYLASVSFMDAQVGTLLAAVDRLKLWDRLVVIFVSDHGYHLGEHGGLWHKMTLFEESARVPLLVAAPNGAQGAASQGLVELVDLFPTLVEFCDLPMPTDLEGASFAPLVQRPRDVWKHAAKTVVGRIESRTAGDKILPAQLGRSLRTSRWRYTRWSDGSRELYDHARDDRELDNLAGNPDSARTIGELDRLLDAPWQQSLGIARAANGAAGDESRSPNR